MRANAVSVRRAPATAARATPPATPASSARATTDFQRARSSARKRYRTAPTSSPSPPPCDSERDRGRRGGGLLRLGLDAPVAHAHDPVGGRGDVVVVRHHEDGL